MTNISIDEVKAKVGTNIGASDWFLIDQDRINQFADVTLDHQFIHIDPDKAKETPFGTTIAHGFLSLSMLSHLCEGVVPRVDGAKAYLNYGFNKVRFISPVKVDSSIRANVTLAQLEEKPGNRYLITYQISVEIEGEEKPALLAEWLTMVLL